MQPELSACRTGYHDINLFGMYPIYRLAVKDDGYALRRAMPAYGGDERNAWAPAV